MRTFLICILSVLALGVSVCVGQSQSKTQDVLYLKNGSIIKGAILELIPDKTVKIQTTDSGIFVFPMTDVEKVSKEEQSGQTLQPQTRMVIQPVSGDTRNRFAFFAGVSIPTGDLASTTGATAGMAKTGFTIGADGSVVMGSNVAWMSSFSFSSNAMDLSTALEAFGITADAGSWTSVWLLTGMRVFGDVSPDVEISGFGQLGLLFGSSPEITLSTSNAQATQSSASATALGYGLGAGLTVKHFMLSIRYMGGEPEYEVTASGGGGSASGKFKQPTSVVLITGGIAF